MGHDTSCGSCMEIAFTGVTTNKHTCREAKKESKVSVKDNLLKKLPDVFFLERDTRMVFNEKWEPLFQLMVVEYENGPFLELIKDGDIVVPEDSPWSNKFKKVPKTLWQKLPKVFYLELLTNKVYNELAECLFELQRGEYDIQTDERKQLDAMEAAGALKYVGGGMWNWTLAAKIEKQ